jgi:hypothetical protein
MRHSAFSLFPARLSPFSMVVLGACWITQLGLASLLSQLAPTPVQPLLVERSFCSEEQRHHLVDRYRELLIKDQLSQQRLSPVIEANVLGVRLNSQAPSLEQFARLASVGEGNREQMASLRRQYPKALVLSCDQP